MTRCLWGMHNSRKRKKMMLWLGDGRREDCELCEHVWRQNPGEEGPLQSRGTRRLERKISKNRKQKLQVEKHKAKIIKL